MLQKILAWTKTHKEICIVAVVLIAAAAFYSYKKSHAQASVRYITGAATTQTITSSIDSTGQITASQQLDLKPQSSGTVVSVNVKQGQEVKAGTVIATLDERSANNQILSARASVAQAQTNYDKVAAGISSDDAALAKLSLDSAQKALDKAKSDYDNTITVQQQAVSKAQTTLLNSGLTLTTQDIASNAGVTLSGTYTGTTEGQYNITLYQAMDGLHYIVSGLSTQTGLLVRGVALPSGNGLYLTISQNGSIYSSANWTIDVPNKTSSSYQTNLLAYTSAQTSQQQAIAQAQNAIDSAQSNLTQAQIQYNQKIAPPSSADVESAKAQLASAQTALANAETAYANNIIKAPFDGVVAKLDVQVGDSASAANAVATLVTKQQLAEISLNEVDAVKIKVGQKANMTFDAIDGLNMTGSVVEIDTIGTVSQGVVSYSAKVALDTQDDRIKPGMSVNVSIITDVATDVLAVPSSAVKTDANGSYVQILVNGKPQNVAVTTGISNDSDTEIKSGLTDNQQIITQTIQTTTAKTSSGNTNNSTFRLPGIGGGGGGGNGNVRVFQTTGGR